MIDLQDLHVGDRVRIRDWDDMASEYGLDEDGDINTVPCFVERMRYLCGTDGSIVKLPLKNSSDALIRLSNDDGWVITLAMIEPIDDDAEPVDQASFFEILMT